MNLTFCSMKASYWFQIKNEGFLHNLLSEKINMFRFKILMYMSERMT